MNDQPTGGPTGPASSASPTLPLEEPGVPILTGLIETLKLFVTSPQEAYRRMPPSAEIFRPLLYGLGIAWSGAFIHFLWGLLIQGSILSVLATMDGFREAPIAMALGIFGGVMGLIVAPAIILILLFLSSGIVHLFLMMVGGANERFVTTLRVFCYSETAQVARIVPFLGGIIAFFWKIVLVVIGLSTAHRTTTGKAVAAVLLPVLLCCVCWGAFMVFVLLLATGASS